MIADHPFTQMGGDSRYQTCCYPVFEDDPKDSLFGLGGPMECGLSREEHTQEKA